MDMDREFEMKKEVLERVVEARLLSERSEFGRNVEAKKEVLLRMVEEQLAKERRERLEFKNEIEVRLLSHRRDLEVSFKEAQQGLSVDTRKSLAQATEASCKEFDTLAARIQEQQQGFAFQLQGVQKQLSGLTGKLCDLGESLSSRAELERLKVQNVIQEELSTFSRQQELAMEGNLSSRAELERLKVKSLIQEELNAFSKQNALTLEGALQSTLSSVNRELSTQKNYAQEQLEEMKISVREAMDEQHQYHKQLQFQRQQQFMEALPGRETPHVPVMRASHLEKTPATPLLPPQTPFSESSGEDPHHDINRPLGPTEFIRFTDTLTGSTWYENPSTGTTLWNLPMDGILVASSNVSGFNPKGGHAPPSK